MTETACWEGRYKTEEILEVGCPRCGVLPGQFCDRDGERLRGRAAELRSQGTPPSHQERMWIRQGHTVADLGRLRARSQPVRYDRPRPRPPAAAGRDSRPRCDCGRLAMPVCGVTRGGRDFTGWGCPARACGFAASR